MGSATLSVGCTDEKRGWMRGKGEYLNAHVRFSDLGYPTLNTVDGEIA
jgi:hypothetical protein